MLDQYQQEVVTEKRNLLVIAGPGSGKTTTIIEKVNSLLQNTPPEQILLLSFTNKSVEDLKKKLKGNVTIFTFHKLAIDILKYNNLEYKIATSNKLNYIIDEFFNNMNAKEKKKFCNYLNITNLNNYNYYSLKKLIITFINLFKTNNHNFDNLKKLVINYKDKYLINIILNILKVYEEEKNSTNEYDFDDLITTANKILHEKYNYKYFKYIIIDEFQDTSLIRLNLIIEIINNCHSTLTAVGDDFQSIYHFSGCDLNIFLNFKKYFPNSTIIYLKNTYRNSQKIIDASLNFINKNPNQMKKNMISKNDQEDNPIKYIYHFNKVKALKKVLNRINDSDIMIIYRNKKDLFKYIDKDYKIENNTLLYKEKVIKILTIHSSKGLEANYVIILNLEDSLLGLPNKIENHPILNYICPLQDNFPFSEERRIFFVALTRCKKYVYLMIPYTNQSIFIKEIKRTNKSF